MPKVTEEHRLARREQIVLAAMRRVAVDGFHKTTMADVVQESGLSAGAVYGYFRSKDEIIAAIAARAGGLASSVVGDVLAIDPLPSLPRALQIMTTSLVEQAEAQEVDLTRVAVNAWAEAVRDEQVRHTIAGQFDEIRGRFTDVVIALQAAGHLDPEADAVLAGRTLFGLLPGFILQRLLVGDVTPQSYAEGLAALTVRS